MIRDNHTWLGEIFFRFYSQIRLHRNFQTIKLCGDFNDTGKSVLIIANHFCWWDGFIQLYLNQKVIGRKFHVLMLEEQLQKNKILKKTGAFSINKSSRDVIESLQYGVELLENTDHMLLIFPQGEIQTMHTRKIVFERGLEYILRRIKGDVDVVFNVNLVDYFSLSKPSLSIYYKHYKVKDPADIKQIEEDYNEYFCQCIEKQSEP